MRTTLALCLLAYGAACVRAAEPIVPVALPAGVADTFVLEVPESVPAGSGFFEVKAKGPGPFAFDVFAVFADPEAKAPSRTFGATLVVGVPASAGAIRIVCAAPGEKGQPPILAVAVVTVTGAAAAARGGLSSAMAGWNVTVIGPAPSEAVRKELAGAGIRLYVLAAQDQRLAARRDLQDVIARTGTPAVIVQDSQGTLRKAEKLPADDAGLISLLNRAAASR